MITSDTTPITVVFKGGGWNKPIFLFYSSGRNNHNSAIEDPIFYMFLFLRNTPNPLTPHPLLHTHAEGIRGGAGIKVQFSYFSAYNEIVIIELLRFIGVIFLYRFPPGSPWWPPISITPTLHHSGIKRGGNNVFLKFAAQDETFITQP